jgi:hypothetical protein
LAQCPNPPRPCPAIPKGLNNSAQGCEARATLGNRPKKTANPNGVASPSLPSPTTTNATPTAHSAFRIPHSALATLRSVADAARSLRALRREIMAANGWSLRELYRTLEIPGANRLRDAHAALDTAVRAAYGMKGTEDALAFLLKSNLDLAAKESAGGSITPPGLPALISTPEDLTTADCIQPS